MKLEKTQTNNKAFTLIELLIVIAIIAVLAAAVIIIVRPGEVLQQARDATRERHLHAVETSLYRYNIEEGGYPSSITETLTEICDTNQYTTQECEEENLIDLSSLNIEIPLDPQGGVNEKGTGYKTAVRDNRVYLDSSNSETRNIDVGINGLVGHWKFDEEDNLICVGKSHWVGGMENGYFSKDHGRATNKLAMMWLKLVDRYATRGNVRGYTYNDEMKGQAIMQLSQIGLQFDESKSNNPFAYYTAAVTNSFVRVINIEKRNQNIRDDILEMNNLNPSYTRQHAGEWEASVKRNSKDSD